MSLLLLIPVTNKFKISVIRVHSPRMVNAKGFTLIEVMIAALIGVLLIITVTNVVVNQLKSTKRSFLFQQVLDDASRLNFFIETEVAESVQINANIPSAAIACPTSPSTTISTTSFLFSLLIPKSTGQFDGSSNTVTTYYYRDTLNNDLKRCGPAINGDGSLNTSGASYTDDIILKNASLCLLTGSGTCTTSSSATNCNSTVTITAAASNPVRELAYQVSLLDTVANVGSIYKPPCSVARSKAYRVIDPP